MARNAAVRREDFDPDRPSDAVGSWPSLDLSRFGLSPLAWLFVGVAGVVGIVHARNMLTVSAQLLPGTLAIAIGSVGTAALPAVLLRRAPNAATTRRLVLAGLVLGAAAELVRSVVVLWPAGPDGQGWFGLPIRDAWAWLLPVSNAVIGMGLIALVGRAPRRVDLLAVLLMTFVGLTFSQLLLGIVNGGSFVIDAIALARLVATPATAAFAAWVSVGAWLDGAQPRRFWTLLAAALLLALVTLGLDTAMAVVVVATRPDGLEGLGVIGFTVTSCVSATSVVLALLAFGRQLPACG